MIFLSDLQDLVRSMLESAEEYNLNDAPLYYTTHEASAWLAGRVDTLHRLDNVLTKSYVEMIDRVEST